MYKKILLSAAFTALLLPLSLIQTAAASSNAKATTALVNNDTEALNINLLKQNIAKYLKANVFSVLETPMPNIAYLTTNLGTFYATYDGKFIIYQGDVYSVEDKVVKLSDLVLADTRLEGIKKFEDEMIVYKAKDEKYVVTVFTDVNCSYCRKMHKQMAEYNERGITFRYMASLVMSRYQENGEFTPGYTAMRSAWCSDNRADALTKIKSGQAIPNRSCDIAIEDQANFGTSIGVKGTPAIILPDGSMGPGYLPPAKLEKMLQEL